MRMVKFDNGKYGLRRWTIFGYEFYDLNEPESHIWWNKGRHILAYCQGTQEQVEDAVRFLKIPLYTDVGKPVK